MTLKTKILQAMTGIGLLLGAAQALAYSLDFQVSTAPIQVGDTFTVDVILRDVFSGMGHGPNDELTSFGYDWDLTPGGILATVGSPVLTPDLTPPYTDAANFADVVGLADLDPIVNAMGQVDALITRFEYTALLAGSTVFSIDGSVPDQNFERGLYYLDLPEAVGFNGAVTLNVEAVPIPGTALLMAMGLGVVGFARRRGR